MLKKVLMPSIALLPMVYGGSALAAVESVSQPASSAAPAAVLVAPKCQLLAKAIAQNPAVENDKLVGTVYSVIGNLILLEKEDGSVEHVYVDWWERGHLGQLRGRKVVIRNVFCSRIDLAPPPPPVVTPIEVPPLQFSPVTPTVPPLTPRPTAPPSQQPAPYVVPQTW
jgi:hypothetical protein